MCISPSKRNYLCAIKKLQDQKTEVKSVHLALYLHVSKPSVSIMIRQLENDGLVRTCRTGRAHHVALTAAGENTVSRIELHRTVLERMFRSLGTSAAAAEKDAASVEPYLSDETYSALCCPARTGSRGVDSSVSE